MSNYEHKYVFTSCAFHRGDPSLTPVGHQAKHHQCSRKRSHSDTFHILEPIVICFSLTGLLSSCQQVFRKSVRPF